MVVAALELLHLIVDEFLAFGVEERRPEHRVSRVDVLALVVGHLAIDPCRLHASAACGVRDVP